MALYKSPSTTGFVLDRVLEAPAIMGATACDFYSGPVWRWDRVNDLYVEITAARWRTPREDSVLDGANALAIENADGEWEIVQFAIRRADRDADNYMLSTLLRGQRGSEHAMRDPVAAGARVLVLDAALAQPGAQRRRRRAGAHWRVGPATATSPTRPTARRRSP